MARNPDVIATNRMIPGNVYFMHTMNTKKTGRKVRLVGYFHNGVMTKDMPKMKALQAGADELKVMDTETHELLTLIVPPAGFIFTLDGIRKTFMKVPETCAPLQIAHDPAPAMAEEMAEA